MTQICISFFVLNFGHWDLDHYLIIGLPARSRFGEGRCLELGYYH